MGIYKYEELMDSPITQGSIYQSGEDGKRGEPLSVLLHAPNSGGIRSKLSDHDRKKRAYIVLVSSNNPKWKNILDPNSNQAIYFGDNTDPNREPQKAKGNKALLEVYKNKLETGFCIPLLIFKKINELKGYEFFSLAVPHIKDGSPGYVEVDTDSEGTQVRNFKFTLDLIKTGETDLRPLLEKLNFEGPDPRILKGINSAQTIEELIPNQAKPPTEQGFLKYLHERGFTFDPAFVVDFLLGLKAKQFLIFCGGTGTGKTKLAQLYSQYCHVEPAIIPVGSNWTECRFITGFINAITGVYSPTAASEIIMSAEDYPTHPHFLILDEMNLSHIERYFSDILSAMESGCPITLGNDEVTIGDNLFIIGTINIDETTYSISPKVLDRANVQSFESANVDDYLDGTNAASNITGDWNFLEDCMNGLEIRNKKAPEIFKEIKVSDSKAADDIHKVLSDIQAAMTDMDLPLGYRTIDEVARFLYAAWIFEGKGKFHSWKHYIDSQILMKILPKIHGDAKITDGLKKLKEVCKDFERSLKSIDKMIHALANRRYTSFIC